jgi:hypothetical protein
VVDYPAADSAGHSCEIFANMKDYELRELFANLEKAIMAATVTVVGGNPHEVCERLSRIQELLEAGRRFEATRLELPSPRVSIIVGMILGTLIFAIGMFAGIFLK